VTNTLAYYKTELMTT